ncbi:MAG: imidazole glycerol phosphate synthase subunit HisF [Rubellimicrobium sp.]|nr:imidazole glycerol phosphate synthase subunit HisF [Rubellimicrobium sp.]
MMTTRIIPCLDTADGRVVKGVNFVDLVDAGDPVEVARAYQAAGATELALLDINATNENRETRADLVRRTAAAITIPLTVGGGMRSVEEMQAILDAGAARVSVNTAAINDPDLIARAAKAFGSARLVVAIDVRQDAPGKWDIVTHGGQRRTGLDPVEFARRAESLGAGEILLTSMDRDGTKDGFDIPLTRAVADAVTIPVIASGGVGTLEHFVEGVRDGHAAGVLAASVFHFGTFSIADVRAALEAAGIAVAA